MSLRRNWVFSHNKVTIYSKMYIFDCENCVVSMLNTSLLLNTIGRVCLDPEKPFEILSEALILSAVPNLRFSFPLILLNRAVFLCCCINASDSKVILSSIKKNRLFQKLHLFAISLMAYIQYTSIHYTIFFVSFISW